VQSQQNTIEQTKSQRIFLNRKENSFMLLDDSTYYYEFVVREGRWKKHPYFFNGECNFLEFQREFIPVATENGEIFFVYRGVGEVYQLVNDTIKRIDRSFRHENQFNGNIFAYRNRICCFGGYGLFTTKNFISYFNIKFKEWMVDDIPYSCKVPAARYSAFSQLNGDDFYIFGGVWSNSVERKTYKDVWKYSFRKNRWMRLGNLHPEGIKSNYCGLFNPEEASNKLLRLEDHMFIVDFQKNRLERFSSQEYKMLLRPIFDVSEQYICAILRKGEDRNTAVVYHRDDILGKPDKSVPLYILDSTNSSFSWLWFLLISFCLFVFTALALILKKRTQPIGNKHVLHQKNGTYYLCGRPLMVEFGAVDTQVLIQFLTAPNNSLEMSDINRILEFDNATLDTIKKRREQSLKNIREKLSLRGEMPFEDVFITSQHPQDRRIKILRLNPKLIE
jgi:hypothetical protein